MIDFRAVAKTYNAATVRWSPFWRIVLVVLSLAVFGCIAYAALFLALGNPGCKVFGSTFFAAYCGSKVGIAMAVAIIVLPIAAYFGMKRPMIFPMALYAFLVPSDSFLNLTSAGSITKLLAVICAGVIIMRIVRNRTFVKPGLGTLLWFVYFTYATASIFWAFLPDQVLFQLYVTFIQLLLFYLALAVMPITEEEFRILTTAYIIGAMASTAFAYETFVSGNAAVVNEGRLKAHFDSENKIASDQFSASLIFPLGLAMMGALRRRFSFAKLANIFAVGVLLVGQYIVGARGGILGDGIMVAYYIWKSGYRAQLIFLATFGLLVSFVVPNAIWARFITPDPSGGSDRMMIWHVAWVAFKHGPIFGQGFANFYEIYDKYFLMVFQPYNADWHRAPHSIIVSTAVELGIVGVALMVGAWYANLRLISGIPKDSPLWDLRVALEGAIIGTFVDAMLVDIMYNKWTWWEFTTLAFVRTLWLREKSRRDAAEVKLEDKTPPVARGEPRPALEMLYKR